MKIFKAWNHPKDINRIKANLLNGSKISSVERRFSTQEFNELKSIAKAQLKARTFFSKGYKLMLNSSDLRFATPEIIGDYRAERIFNELGRVKVVDLFSGVGLQTISFAKKLKHVLSVEIDKRKFLYSEKNMRTFGLRNVTLVNGNVFSDEVFSRVKEVRPEVIFADPQRKEFGDRSDEEELIVRIYTKFSEVTENMIIEVPPYINLESLRKKLPKFEAEFLSVDFNLRRLTLYFGDLRRFRTSAVSLPSMAYTGSDGCVNKLAEADSPRKFLFELDEALTMSKVFNCLFKGAELLDCGRKAILTSDNFIEGVDSAFFQAYEVLFFKDFEDEFDEEILKKLNAFNFKYVVLKQGFNSHTYWSVRKRYESELGNNANKIAYLFKVKDKLVLCQLVNPISN